jgi:DNA-binding transcriptional ArsR family regulator
MSNTRNNDPGSLATQFKALAHPDRLRMLVKLLASTTGGRSGRSFCCVGDLAREVDLAPSTVSHHLKELRQAGLIEVERRGRQIECRTGGDTLRRLASFFGECCPETRTGPLSTQRAKR